MGGAYESGYGTIGSSLLTADGTYLDFCIDAENDYKYQVKVCLDGISIIKHKMSPEVFDVFRSSTTYQSFVEETYAETFTGTYFLCTQGSGATIILAIGIQNDEQTYDVCHYCIS